MSLAGRVALVTGAGRRVGQAIAIGLAEAGHDVAIHHHTATDGAADTAARVRALGRRAELFPADLRDAHAARRLPDEVAARFGRLDVLVNSAAVFPKESLEAVTPESWDATLAVNLRACFFTAQGAAPHLRRAGAGGARGGRIVNIADVAAFQPWPSYIPYGVSKAGVVLLTKSLARALAPEVTVNAVAPGGVLPPEDWTEEQRERFAQSTPVGRLGSAGDVVGAVRYFVELGDYVTGTLLVVDGGRAGGLG